MNMNDDIKMNCELLTCIKKYKLKNVIKPCVGPFCLLT